MRTNRFYVFTSGFILLVLGYLTYQILQPFVSAFLWAAVFSIVFYPLYKFILKIVKYGSIASTITAFIILLVIIGPFFSISFLLIDELKDFGAKTDKSALESIRDFFEAPQIARLTKKIQTYLGLTDVSPADIIVGNFRKFGQDILSHFSALITNMTNMIIDLMFMLFTVFFLLKDGPDLLNKIKDYLPFSDEQKRRLASQINDMVVSTVYGGVVVAIIQGLFGGIAFFALGLNSPVLWGAAMTIVSFLPVFGTFIIWGPASIYLMFTGSLLKGIVLMLFGIIVIGIIDNMLRPIIISGRTKMPTLLIFFSVLGGMSFFGFIGLITGPLVLALFLSVFAIFKTSEADANA